MKYQNIHLTNKAANDTIYCLGFFDGLHLGHQELIKETIKIARDSNKKAGLLTFTSFGNTKTSKHNTNKVILTNEQKNKLLESYELDIITYIDFDEECMSTTKEDFIKFLKQELSCVGVIVGTDYRFGYKGEGDISYLKKIESYDFIVNIIEPLKVDDEIVSTTKIIEYLRLGNIEKVNKFLGRNYSINGVVKEGFHIGTTLEFPTANVEFNKELIAPLYGVYGVKVFIDNKEYKGISNIGIRPSINTLEHPLVETNILNYQGNLYDKEIIIEFICFIRQEQKFQSIRELKEQIKEDKKKLLKYLENN